MKLPSFNYMLPRDTEPVGLARYLDIFFVNIASLILANFLFLLSCITIIGTGAGIIALNHLVCSIIQGKKTRIAQDFFLALKQNLKSGFIVSFTLLPLLVWSLYMALSAYGNYIESRAYLPQFFMFSALFILTNCFSMYFLPLLLYMKSDLYTILITSFKLCVLGTWRTVIGGLGESALAVVILMLLPKSLPLILLIHFSFSVYHCVFFSLAIIDKYITLSAEEEQKQDLFE